ncbi:MAG TPA: non-homologous end-joining DNA ligase, partial [Candidatus Binatia bacterium]|nr:non-homologous end-joining DNA ligase [Candidatus Binatia bacterium]
MPAKKKPLAEYDRKRSFERTPEPSGKRGRTTATKRRGTKKLRFVVQQHHARRLHYDFRLEVGGVLASWAIPKGPSMNPADRHLAVHVEDHPFDYRAFEGVIPAGNYGAGSVIVWDEGTWQLAEGNDPAKEIKNGKIKFVLHGKKLKGLFTLVKMRGARYADGDNWLIIKDHDEFEDPHWKIERYSKSVKSGRTVDEIAHSSHVKKWISDRPSSTGLKHKIMSKPAARLPRNLGVMLATLIDAPFDDQNWLFEIKWDGFRALCTVTADGRVDLRSRNDKDLLAKFPELESLGEAFSSLPIIVDGEIVSLDERGRSSFQRLQNRIESRRAKPRGGDGAITYVAFDLLYADGRDLRGEPLEERKRLLEQLLIPGHGAMYSKHVVGRGKELFALAQREHLEGIIGKRRDSTYQTRRSRDWVKIKALHEQEFVIGGWTEPRGSRAAFGALLLGVYDRDDLVYVGHVGTGFDAELLDA